MQADEVSAKTTVYILCLYCHMCFLTSVVLQKKKFDSADYFTEHEKLKKAAGLDGGAKKDGEGQGEEHKEEAKK